MIRSYADSDLDELLDVWERASRIAHSFLDEEFFARERRDIAERWIPISETSVYETDGRVVGFVSLVDYEVGGIFVDPDYQRRGIGRALMDHARRSHSILELEVLEANELGRGFYAAYGFDEVDRHIDEATGRPAIHLRLE